MEGFPEHYDLGIKDFVIGGLLKAIHLVTRQMGHEPSEAPLVPTEPLPIERLSQMIISHETEG